jgi:hypothetical protein
VPVERLERAPGYSGLIEIETPTFDAWPILESSGRLDVVDRINRVVYSAQAISCDGSDPDRLRWLATPIGAIEVDHDPDREEDYLVVSGHPPLRLKGLTVGWTQCAKGHHVRVEVEAHGWCGLPIRHRPDHRCRCVRNPDRRRGDNAEQRVWPVVPIAIAPTQDNQRPTVSVVRLQQRRTLRLCLDLAMVEADSAVTIGHLLGSEPFAETGRCGGEPRGALASTNGARLGPFRSEPSSGGSDSASVG